MAKKIKRREQKKKKTHTYGYPSQIGLMRQAGNWPLLECLISAEWQKPLGLTQIAIVRQSAQTGQVAVAGYLVDLGCLGVKNAMANLYPSKGEYQRHYREHLFESQEITPCALNLAVKVIDKAVAYAKSLGFEPHSDIKYANLIRGEAHPELCHFDIPVGDEDGKPFFFAGPYDNVERIMRILDRNVGPGNYHYLMEIGDPHMFDNDKEDEDWGE